MSADLIIILALVAMLLLLLPNKKAQEAKMEKDYDNMMKEGNFTGLKTMFRKQFLIWGILFLIALTDPESIIHQCLDCFCHQVNPRRRY